MSEVGCHRSTRRDQQEAQQGPLFRGRHVEVPSALGDLERSEYPEVHPSPFPFVLPTLCNRVQSR